MADEVIAHLAPGRQHVEHTGRNARFLDGFGQNVRVDRRLGRGLADHGAACRQRGRDLVDQQHERCVPRRHRRDHTHGLLDHAHLVAAHRADALIDELVAVAQIAVEFEQAGDLIARLAGEADDGTDLASPGLGQFGHAGHQNVGDLLEVDAALGRAHPRPRAGIEGATRCRDGDVHIGRGRLEIGEDSLFIMRCDDRQFIAAAALAPVAIDEKLGRAAILDAFDRLGEVFHPRIS